MWVSSLISGRFAFALVSLFSVINLILYVQAFLANSSSLGSSRCYRSSFCPLLALLTIHASMCNSLLLAQNPLQGLFKAILPYVSPLSSVFRGSLAGNSHLSQIFSPFPYHFTDLSPLDFQEVLRKNTLFPLLAPLHYSPISWFLLLFFGLLPLPVTKERTLNKLWIRRTKWLLGEFLQYFGMITMDLHIKKTHIILECTAMTFVSFWY